MTFSPRTCWRCLRDLAATLAALRAPGERALFVRICLLAPLVPHLMRLPLHRVNRLITATPPARRRRPVVPPERVAELVEMTQARLHPLVRRGCLTRGLSLLWILRRRGLDVRLAFGIGGAQDGDQGHCWLVLDGTPYLERHPVDGRFVEMYRIPGALAG